MAPASGRYAFQEGLRRWRRMERHQAPGGHEVGYCAWGVMHDEGFWGEDAGVFRPERRLDVDALRLKAMDAALALTFGHGRWQCLGKEVALMELNKVFVELLRRFDLSVVDPTKPWSDFWIKAERQDTHVRTGR